VETPVKLSKQQRDLLQQFEASFGDDAGKHTPRASSWFDGVKRFVERVTS
ncbi:MAG TPA: molecular chaperone DnaJ, partial [Rudaea sp.]|nr:molecular chaperone DnaJ [Rudaea sp.]